MPPEEIPDAALRAARIRAHEVFDRIWKTEAKESNGAVSRNAARRKAYNWLRIVMQVSRSKAHISQFSVEQCNELIRKAYQQHPHLHNGFSRLLYGEFD